MSSDTSMNFTVTAKNKIFDGFFKMYRYQFNYDTYNGEAFTGVSREVFARGNAVGVLLIDMVREKVVLVEQFRAGAAAGGAKNPWLVELIAGMIEAGEEPSDVAIRESQEEAGVCPNNLQFMMEYWASPGGCDEKFFLFCGAIDSAKLPKTGGLDEEHEDIRVHAIAFQEAFDWLEQGKWNNGMTIIGIQWLKLNQENLTQLAVE